MDACGPRVPIGGGARSGKDSFEADRTDALYARRLSRLMANMGVSDGVTVTVGFRPGAGEVQILRTTGASLDEARRGARLPDAS